ncbi:MAG: HAD family hydrolase [Candidatus Pacebacteria bacterium]|nr:HAD family hydrolase [Candidatus Paceibacterota bacterium]MCF7862970.1 HAD family hydrolase [Candidatus Paceibacterota bacterium]
MKIIFDYNRTIFNPDTDNLYFGVLNLLKKLSKKYELFLVSRNEPNRKYMLEKLNIKNYFQEIFFLEKKSKKNFQLIAKGTKNVVVVGDSISDEIQIGNQLGFITVRLKKGKFATQIPKNKKEFAKFEIMDIRELENIILNHEK